MIKVVEMYGLPGCGKTTYFNRILESKRSSNVNVVGKEEVISLIKNCSINLKLISFVNVFPRFLMLLGNIKKRQGEQLKPYLYAVRLLFLALFKHHLMLALLQKGDSRNDSIVVLDQWVLQDLWSVEVKYGLVNKAEILSSIYKGIDFDYTVIWILVDERTCKESINTRSDGDSFLDGKADEYISSYLEIGNAICNEAILELESVIVSSNFRVLRKLRTELNSL